MSGTTSILADDAHAFPADGAAPIVVTRPADGDGVTVIDLVERHRYTLSTAPGGQLQPVEPARLLFPVDTAVELTTDHLTVEDVPSLYVRNEDGGMLATTEPPSDQSFPAGEYYLEIGGPMKVYLRLEGPLTVASTPAGKRIDLGAERRVLLGARSKHERPAGTVTTTAKPVDVMAAVSTFGSALKTTSPERSFPTLRGHPPTLELGDELSVPDGLAPPETGVTIEVPRDYRHVFPVASLAHYLGARVVPGDRPRLVTASGFVHDLAPDGAFERELERVLKGTFLLDCVVRTEGLYDVALHERRAVEAAVDLDFAALYDQPLAERLETYLGVPYETLAPHVPDWKLTTHVATDAESIETLPFVVNDLAVIRRDRTEPSPERAHTPEETAEPEAEAEEAAAERAVDKAAIESFLRSSDGPAASASTSVVPAPLSGGEAMERAWVGDGVCVGMSKAVPQAYRNGLDRTPAEGDVDITVVYNDMQMTGETSVVRGVYGDDDDLPFDVTRHSMLGTEELREVLAGESSFLHYVGHIEDDGFECVDGTLDARTLESTGVESFLLNGCMSYEQGMALIEAGAVGGVVTLADVVNDSAVMVGSTVARLLNGGYPLRPALEIAREVSYVGDDYVVLGDGNFAVAQSTDRGLFLYRVEQDDGGFVIDIVSYTTTTGGMGTMTIPHVGDNDEYYLGPGLLDSFRVSGDDLDEFFQISDKPVLLDRSLYWSRDLDAEKVESLLPD